MSRCSLVPPKENEVSLARSTLKGFREESAVPVFLNADHTHSLAKAVEGAKAGFDSVVIDFSTLPFEENVCRKPRGDQVNQYCRLSGCGLRAD